MNSRWINRGLALVALTALSVMGTGTTGCHLILGIRPEYELAEEGLGGEGQGGGGGAGGGCGAPDACPGTDTDCRKRTCIDGQCGFENAPFGTSKLSQTPGDCLESVCDGQGATTTQNSDTDVLDDGNPCTDDVCNAGVPENNPSAAKTACSVGAGTLCDGDGACVECVDLSDCSSGVCEANACVPPTCLDEVRNGNETSVDCGGADCTPCADGQPCALDDDCMNHVCGGGVCQAPTCSDTVKNDVETDIDCGGGTCAPCAFNKGCAQDADCIGGSCSGSLCLATCTDQEKNANETDVDCGGPLCGPCDVGKTCAVGTDCSSGVCENGTCAAPVCGDGVVNGAEQCDDANQDNTDACIMTCASASCGDGFIQAGVEECDDANQDDTDACPGTCKAAFCGDGFMSMGEECDDGNQSNTDGCVSTCVVAACGDSYIEVGVEQCDDANPADGDCCSSGCMLEASCEIEPNNSVAQAALIASFPQSGIIKGFISPIGDVDYFAIDVAGTIDLKIETFYGFMPGACVAADTEMSLIGPDGVTALAYDDDDGLGTCSLINPVSDSGARGLTPGKYYLKVNEYGNNVTIDGYSIQLTVTATCGDGLTGGSETCDDGNTSNGDGCSSACRLEQVPEVEPNTTCFQANGMIMLKPSPGTLNAGAITPLGDADWFSFNLTSTADVVFETFGANGPSTCSGIDTNIEVFKSDCVTALGPAKDQGGVGNCSKLDPDIDPQVRHLPPGVYFVKVTEYNNDGTIAGYTLNARLTAVCGNGALEGFEECDGGANCDANCDRIAMCGDGFVDAPEACDDGNALVGDGCTGACSVEAGFVCSTSGGPCIAICGDGIIKAGESCDDSNTVNGDGCDSSCRIESPTSAEIEPNGTFAEADARAMGSPPVIITGNTTTISGAITPVADKDIFKMNLAASSVVRFETFDGTGSGCAGGITTFIRIFNSAAMPTQITTDAASGISSCSALVYNLAAGSYYVQVEESGNNATIAAYRVQVKIQVNKGAESEPNATTAQPDALPGSDVFILGSHQVQTDVDYFALAVPAGKSLRAELIEGGAETCESNEVDSHIALFSPTFTQLAEDDDTGRGYCSLIDGTGATPLHAGAKSLPAGTYFLKVRASNLLSAQTGTSGQFDYRLAVTLR
jgi:cysteine-rich repeat protein